jgi:hypothetical protein
MRHRLHEPKLNKIFPWLASERLELFNAYQQTQRERVERAMERLKGKGYVASFIRREAGKALFVGLYAITGSKPLTYEEFWQVPAFIELKALGMKGWEVNEARPSSVLWFDLISTDFFLEWKGKLIVGWPKPERLSRRLHGEANRAGCWSRQKTGLSTPTFNGGMPHEPTATRSKS